jgi:hypothetical protein
MLRDDRRLLELAMQLYTYMWMLIGIARCVVILAKEYVVLDQDVLG